MYGGFGCLVFPRWLGWWVGCGLWVMVGFSNLPWVGVLRWLFDVGLLLNLGLL